MCRSAPAADSACAAADADWSDGLADPHGGGARRSEVHCERSVPSRRSPAFRHGLAAKGPENWCPAAGPKPPDSLGERAPGYATDVDEAGRQRYDDLLRSSLLPGGGGGRLLGYGGCPPRADGPLGAAVDGCPSQRGVEPPRRFPKDPFRVLQAHGLRDDYYSTLLDFAAADDLAVGLGSAVDLWSSKTRISSRLVQLRGADVVQSVKWSAAVCSSLAVGTLAGEVQIWDASSARAVRSLVGHRGRVGCMAWHEGLLFTAGCDGHILLRDLRSPAHYVAKLAGHGHEVCGLSWSPMSQQLASGGNDGAVLTWSIRSSTPERKFEGHAAGVRALAWSPHERGLLASGGGSADKSIRTWSSLNGASLSCTDAGSQVCNLVWSEGADELLSSHGYWSNEVALWRRGDMSRVAVLPGHSRRVVHLAVSPDGRTIVTGTGDEMLRFWNMCPGPRLRAGQQCFETASCLTRTIR